MPISVGLPGVVTVSVAAPGLPVDISVGVSSGILDSGDTSPTPTTSVTPTPVDTGSGVSSSTLDLWNVSANFVKAGGYTYYQGKTAMLRYRKVVQESNTYCVWLSADPETQAPDYCIVNPPISTEEDAVQAVLRIVEEAANL